MVEQAKHVKKPKRYENHDAHKHENQYAYSYVLLLEPLLPLSIYTLCDGQYPPRPLEFRRKDSKAGKNNQPPRTRIRNSNETKKDDCPTSDRNANSLRLFFHLLHMYLSYLSFAFLASLAP